MSTQIDNNAYYIPTGNQPKQLEEPHLRSNGTTYASKADGYYMDEKNYITTS